MKYVDAFVASVQTGKRDAYLAHAKKFDLLFKEHGAARVVECWEGDVPEGKLTSFPLAVKREPGEAVVFGFIEWASKQARDAAWEKLRNHPDMQGMANMPFDGKRMIYGGFDVIMEV